MKTIISIFLSMTTAIVLQAQKKSEVEAQLILVNSSDTLRTGLVIQNNLFDKTLLNSCSVTSNPKFTNNNIYVSTADIKYLTFIDDKGEKRIFRNYSVIPTNKRHDLVEVFHEGKRIKWYIDFFINSYDWSCNGKWHVFKDGTKVKLRVSKDLKSILFDQPDLIDEIESIKKITNYKERYDLVKKILAGYESLSSNN